MPGRKSGPKPDSVGAGQSDRPPEGACRRLVAGQQLVVASHNPGKVWEIRKLIAPFGIEAVSAADLRLPEPEETETTFAGNAELKARAAALASGLPALADDSGLEVACLGGAPGIYSARWAGPTKDFGFAMRKVAEEITARHGWTAPGPAANFICALCLAWPDGPSDVYIGRIDGVLVWPPRGANGFGYDAMFAPDGYEMTFGEMEPPAKNAMSHRALAFASFTKACLGQKSADAIGSDGHARVDGPTNTESLSAAAQSVSTREEFIRFVASLRDDLAENSQDWHNATLDRYLDGIGGVTTNASVPPEPVWRSLAKTLFAASRHK